MRSLLYGTGIINFVTYLWFYDESFYASGVLMGYNSKDEALSIFFVPLLLMRSFLCRICWCDRFCSSASTAFLRPANLIVGSDIMRSFSSFSRILLSRAMRLCSFPLFFSCDKWSCFTFHSDHFLRGRDPFYFADSSWTRTPTCQRGEVL